MQLEMEHSNARCAVNGGVGIVLNQFMQANRAHTYLGKRESEWHESGNEEDIYPNFVGMAKSFGVPAARVIKKEELRGAIRTMLDTPGPYLLEVSWRWLQRCCEVQAVHVDTFICAWSVGVCRRCVLPLSQRLHNNRPPPFNTQVMVPHIEHVLPMIPGGASFKEIIVEGDGTRKY